MMTMLPNSVPEMEHFNLGTLQQVADMAATMSEDEILKTFSIKRADLTTDELIYFQQFYNYGRGMAVHLVGQNLIESTKGKGGAQAAIAFLRRFAEEWEGEEALSDGKFSFHFGEQTIQ